MMNEKIVVAVRVLTSFHNHTDPVQSDIENLRSWVRSLDRSADPDELACIVIIAETQRVQNARGRSNTKQIL